MKNDPRTQIFQRFNHPNMYYHNHSTNSRNYESGNSNFVVDDDQGVVQFRPNMKNQESNESDDSGVCSPPLWKNSPSPSKSPSQPLLGGFKSLSPNSRTQAIARGQRELMEMVKNMPESSYELSLKDLVEHRDIVNQNVHDHGLDQRGVVKAVKRQESLRSDKNMMRSGSFETKGLFLNMVFPFSVKSKKKKKFDSNSSGKVSPRPDGVKNNGSGGGEKDWWKKKFSGSSDSDSSKTSNNSGSSGSTGSSGGDGSSSRSNSGGRKKNGKLTGCWSFFLSKNTKSV